MDPIDCVLWSGEIINFIFSLFVQPGKDLVKEHYGIASAREFFPKLSKFMTSGPVVATVWEGPNAVQAGRRLIGARDAIESSPGSIRGSFSLYHHNHHRNIVHGSDCIEEANREIALWFSEDELVSWTSAIDSWANERQS